MSNISLPHYEIIRSHAKPWDLSLFDAIFTSAEVGRRKPDLEFYEYVLREIGLEESPSSVIFVDDKLENVLSARSLGIQAIQFNTRDAVIQQLSNALEDPIYRGMKYLKQKAKMMQSKCDNGMAVKENFGQLLILEATRDR
ncbi:hypothetical protein ABW20_dc0108273 [Dactylellina cionopaga]|nr:hypothetical protein ABW20_dc0108273 [Dactylellina cionopaga]